jgi:hypothetical protein
VELIEERDDFLVLAVDGGDSQRELVFPDGTGHWADAFLRWFPVWCFRDKRESVC